MHLGKTLSGQADQFVSAMTELRRRWDTQRPGDPRRILICGCADYSMFAHVLHAFGDGRPRPLVTALDRCRTPLLLTEWYAARLEAPVELACADVLRYEPEQAFDLIVTSGFLGYFDPAQRGALFERCCSLLRPGGQLVFSNRLRATSEAVPIGFTDAQADDFARKVELLSRHLPRSSPLQPEEAYRIARGYARDLSSYPVNSADSIRRLTDRAGLQWMSESRAPSAAVRAATSGPTMDDGASYLFAVLEKPDPNDAR